MNSNKYIKIVILILGLLSVSMGQLHANKINTIEIIGNDRITNETILSFLPKIVGEDISNEKINEITKDLYDTNFFENINVSIKNNTLSIVLVENPIIQNITYNGVKSDRLRNLITENLKLINRSSFVKIYAEQDITTILNNLKKKWLFFF